MKNEKWSIKGKKGDFEFIMNTFGVTACTARLLINRGKTEERDIREFLYPDESMLYPQSQMRNLLAAADVIEEKLSSRKKIRVIGDYDADGIMSTYILTDALKKIGAEADFYIPDRMRDGYGINPDMITVAANDGIDTIITCDNGISATDAADEALERGITLIVTDHHELPEVLPEAKVIVDPKHPDDTYPCKNICGAVVAAKLASELLERKNIVPKGKGVLRYLEFMAIATICDVVPLDGENRTIASLGLKKLNSEYLGSVDESSGINLGLKALIDSCDLKEKISDYHIGFVIGPCLNATGRLDLAARAMELLCSKDMKQALALAQQCRDLNQERKDMTFRETEKAFKLLEVAGNGITTSGNTENSNTRNGSAANGNTENSNARNGSTANGNIGSSVIESSILEILNSEIIKITGEATKNDKILVVVLPDCHESLAGIIAGRVREKYNKPTFVLTGAQNGIKGSGRSIPGYNMFGELQKCSELFTKFGGHPMAAGLSLPTENVAEFRKRLNENCTLTDEDLMRRVELDAAVTIGCFDEKSVEELNLFYPCGQENPTPIFGDMNVNVIRMRRIGKNNNFLRFNFEDSKGYKFQAIYFKDIEELLECIAEKFGQNSVDLAFEGMPNNIKLTLSYVPEINEYNGVRSIQMKVQGFLF